MGKLYNFKCYWNTNFENKFTNDEMHKGKFILKKKGWFEGIIPNPNDPEKMGSLVFGYYYPDSFIYLYQIPTGSPTVPFLFTGLKTTDGYDGSFDVFRSGYEQKRIAKAYIVTEKRKKNDSDLKSEIKMYKTALDPAGIDFYEKIKSDKDNMNSKAKEFKLRRRYIEVPSTN